MCPMLLQFFSCRTVIACPAHYYKLRGFSEDCPDQGKAEVCGFTQNMTSDNKIDQ